MICEECGQDYNHNSRICPKCSEKADRAVFGLLVCIILACFVWVVGVKVFGW